jgi:hypothetical protein
MLLSARVYTCESPEAYDNTVHTDFTSPSSSVLKSMEPTRAMVLVWTIGERRLVFVVNLNEVDGLERCPLRSWTSFYLDGA